MYSKEAAQKQKIFRKDLEQLENNWSKLGKHLEDWKTFRRGGILGKQLEKPWKNWTTYSKGFADLENILLRLERLGKYLKNDGILGKC